MHSLAGASVLHDIARLDLRSLVVDIWDQGRWPPLGSLLQIPTLAVLGINVAAHRMAILVLLLPTIAVLAAAARGLVEEEDGPGAMVIVGGLALSSGVLLLASASVLYEVPGMAIAIGAYLAANEGWKTKKAGWFWLGSVLLAAAWFTKWQYGIVATVALLAAGIVRKRRGEGGVAAGDYLYVVPIVTLAVWFASAYHMREFGLYMLWQPSSLAKLSHYAQQYGGAALHGGWVTKLNVALTMIGLGMAAPLVLRTPLGVALATHVVVAGLGSGSKDMSDRIALWIVIPAWVLAAAGWARVVGRSGEWARKTAAAWPWARWSSSSAGSATRPVNGSCMAGSVRRRLVRTGGAIRRGGRAFRGTTGDDRRVAAVHLALPRALATAAPSLGRTLLAAAGEDRRVADAATGCRGSSAGAIRSAAVRAAPRREPARAGDRAARSTSRSCACARGPTPADRGADRLGEGGRDDEEGGGEGVSSGSKVEVYQCEPVYTPDG